jgi:long-chain acyl-CoA synthetase
MPARGAAPRAGSEPSTVRALVDRMGDTHAGRTFLVAPETGRLVAFGELRDQARALAGRLCALGLEKGDKVAVLMDNGAFTAELWLGAMYGGFVPVPLNVTAGRSQLAYTLGHSDARLVVVAEEYRALLDDAVADLGRSIPTALADPDAGWGDPIPPTTALPRVDEGDAAVLVYTSGTTGVPKGVLLSHRAILAGGAISVRAHLLTGDDRSLCVLPLYHANAQITTILSTLLSGGSVVLPRRFDATRFWDWVVDQRCTWFALVPTFVALLLRSTDPRATRPDEDFRPIRFARCSSAPLAAAHHRAFEERFRLPLIEAMGSTEAGGAIFSNPVPPGTSKIGSPGVAHGHEAAIVDADGRELPAGQTGEIVVRGPSVMTGYYKDPRATAEVLTPDGWLHTGDQGLRDDDGYFFVTGRIKELINKGGEKIAPREIDEALERHPAVLEAAVAAVHDAYLGEDIAAYVALKPGASCDARELLAFCALELGPFRTPSSVHLVPHLPRGATGKVQRRRLAELAPRPSADVAGAGEASVGSPASALDSQPSGLRGLVEEVLVAIWAEVLGRGQVRARDDFFALGGHSLGAARVMGRVRDALNVELPVSALFDAPTPAALAARIVGSRGDLVEPGGAAHAPAGQVVA